MKVSTHRLGCGFLLAALVFGVGCSANYYRKSADQAVYKSLAQRTPAVPNMDTNFTIEQTNVLSLDHLPVSTNVFDFLGPDADQEVNARVMTLDEALLIAVQHNRAYQTRKEQLYTSALTLTLARHRFTPLFTGGARGRIIGQTERALRVDVDPVTQQPKVVLSDDLIEQRRVAADGNINVSWLIRDIGLLTASISSDFLRYVTGDPRALTSSQAGVALSRPLLRNAGFKLQMEQLTQAERDLLYDLRAFTQFRKTFSVQVASAYYAVLGSRDTVRNNYLNVLSSRLNAERTGELAREGRVTQADLGRLEQQVLSTESAWNNARRVYKQSLDTFKLQQLGMAVDTRILLEDAELRALEIRDPQIQLDDAVQVGLTARLDYLNGKDRYQDALRRVNLAADGLKPQVDLVSSVSIRNSPDQRTGLPVPDVARYNWSAGLNVDMPFDRLAERNIYRTSMIAEQQAARALEQQADEIRIDVRENWRQLDSAKRNFEIAQLGVQLAERRVDEQNLLAEVGRAKAQDQVDAQNDLITSKNQLTQALVSHTIARLQFWASTGILYIKDNGQWKDLNDGQQTP